MPVVLIAVRAQYEAAVEHREQARTHEGLVGKAPLELKRSDRHAWREVMNYLFISQPVMRAHVRVAEQLEEPAAKVR